MFEFLVKQIIHSGSSFVRRWYLDRSLWFWSRFSEIILLLDRRFAAFINLKLFFTPLYGDYSLAGKILGPLFRVWRVAAGLLVYICLGMIAAAIWLGYCLFLPYLVFKAIA